MTDRITDLEAELAATKKRCNQLDELAAGIQQHADELVRAYDALTTPDRPLKPIILSRWLVDGLRKACEARVEDMRGESGLIDALHVELAAVREQRDALLAIVREFCAPTDRARLLVHAVLDAKEKADA